MTRTSLPLRFSTRLSTATAVSIATVMAAVGTMLLASFFAASAAFAKAPPETAALQKNVPGHETPLRSTDGPGVARRNPATGALSSMANLRVPVAGGDAESMARGFLRDHAVQLGLQYADTSDLVLHAVREGKSGTTVRFRQTAGGLDVYRARVAVTFNRRGEVRTVSSTYQPRAQQPAAFTTLPAGAAEALALDYLGLGFGEIDRGLVTWTSDDLVDVLDGASYSVRRVVFTAPGSLAGWEILVDQATGDVLRAVDTNAYATGDGLVFAPDPLSSALADYGDPGFSDNDDADSPEMTAESPSVTLLDITDNAGTFFLIGPWAELVDWDSPFKGDFSQNSSSFTGTREDDSFEAVNCYFHIDAYMRYLNVTLGVIVEPHQYPGGVQYDPSGFNGADNSSYSSGSGRLRFGEGGVDDGEDADVVIHELGHGLHDWITSGGLSQNQGLSEGTGDYAAVSYSRTFPGQWTPADPQYNWVFSWDGHNPFWNGRVTDWNDTRVYPDDLTGSIHTDGQFWASCNIDIWEQIGPADADTAFWEGLARTGGGTNQEEAAQAVLDAASDLGIAIGSIQTMLDVYTACGYDVEANLGLIFVDGFESGDTSSWSVTVN